MASNADFFLKKTLGEDFFESLEKVELWKPGTKTTLDHEEIRTALQIVPRTLMSFLISHLSGMQIGDNKYLQLPVSAMGAMLRVTKHERDVYSGQIEQSGKVVVDYKFRSIPGVGLVIMSAFELYEADKMLAAPPVEEDVSTKIQKLIDERLALHDLIDRVVDKKIAHKDAVNNLLLMKLTEEIEKTRSKVTEIVKISKTTVPMEDPYFRGMANGIAVADSIVNNKEAEFVDAPKKKRPLIEFLESRKKKLAKNEYEIHMAKGESVNCPDCNKNIFDGSVFSGCICLGDDREKKVFIKKSEDGIKVRFSKGWDQENIEMLLETLRRKRG